MKCKYFVEEYLSPLFLTVMIKRDLRGGASPLRSEESDVASSPGLRLLPARAVIPALQRTKGA